MNDNPLITIHPNDPSDDEAFDAWYSVFRAASTFDRGPAAPVWPKTELSAELRTQRASHSNELYLIHRDSDVRKITSVGSGETLPGQTSSPIGAIALTIPLKDNLHRVDVSLYVEPSSRRRGCGTAMLEFVSSRTKQLGRRVIATEVFRPLNDVAAEDESSRDHASMVPGIAFAENHDVTFAIGDLRSECALPLDSQALNSLAEEARRLHDRYEVRTWAGDVPEEFVDQWAQMEGLIETEAPTGAREIEPETTTAADIREQEAIFRVQGRSSFAAIALDPSGAVAAYTQLVHSSAEGMVYQWGTMVRKEHRGHRLGAAVKAAAAQEFAESGLAASAIITYNAEENQHMLAINRALGFRPVERIEEVELNVGR